MKTIYLFAALALLVGSPLLAQTPKPKTAAAGLAKPDASSNADLNIRAYIELLRTDLRSSKSQIMGEVLQLETDQSVKFWPIYKAYESEYTQLGDRIASVVTKYVAEFPNLKDETADQLGQQVLSIEQDRNALKKKYYDRIKQSLGSIIGMRFLQVENQLERIVDLQIAAGLPIAEGR